MRFLLAAALVLATPALAQQPAPAPGAAVPGAQAPAARATAARPAAGRAATTQVSGTPGTGGTRTVETGPSPIRAVAEVEVAMKRAQKAADDRAAAWDSKMKRTMGSICSGC
jgi:hypothetical protein